MVSNNLSLLVQEINIKILLNLKPVENNRTL